MGEQKLHYENMGGRRDSGWIPLECRMFWCKQRADHALVDWANEEVGLLTVRGDPAQHDETPARYPPTLLGSDAHGVAFGLLGRVG